MLAPVRESIKPVTIVYPLTNRNVGVCRLAFAGNTRAVGPRALERPCHFITPRRLLSRHA